MKKGLSILATIFVITIVIVFILIVISLTVSYIKSKSLDGINQTIKDNLTNTNPVNNDSNSTDKDLNYYLPAEFAAIKLTRGYYQANITGVLISFKDDSKTYDYNSTEYPGIEGTRTYTILKDELSPKVPDNWDFTKVEEVSLRYILSNGNPSAIINTVKISPNKISPNFGEKCSSTDEGQVLCE